MNPNNEWQAEIAQSFGLIFILEKRLAYIFDKVLAPHNLTAKQWLVLAAIDKSPEDKPSILEVARQLSTSHQNIKAIALNLEKLGFINLEKDQKDKRVTRLSTTLKSKEFWQNRESEDKALLQEIFKHLSLEEITFLHKTLFTLLQGADELADRLNLERKHGQE